MLEKEGYHLDRWLEARQLGGGGSVRLADRRGLDRQMLHLGDNKEVFGAEVFAIYQALRIFEARQQSGEKYTIFLASQWWALSDALGPGEQWARAIIEAASRLIESGNQVLILWVPAHVGVTGNKVADGMAKEAAAGQTHDVPDQVHWQASLPHLARRATK